MSLWAIPRTLACCLAILPAQADDALLDRLDEALTFGTADGAARARFSGTLDLEGYRFSQPAPAFIAADGVGLFVPRFSTFLDVQLGQSVYAFVQTRVDRGFDPATERWELRLDEYALRITPWRDGRLSVQLGKFATVFGNWVSRHGSWDNPFVSAPLPYENQTGIWDASVARSAGTLLAWAHVRPRPAAGAPATDKSLRLPVIWGPSYVPGVSVSGSRGRFDFAAELKASSLSSRPSVWTDVDDRWRHPTLTARVGYRPDARWNLGASASGGSYLTSAAAASLPPGLGLGDYREIVVGQDVGFAWHHLQLWAEIFEARFEIPHVGQADTAAYYIEGRYQFSPQFFGALRWNEQLFGHIPDGLGGESRWGGNLWRIDCAPTYRFTAHTQLKLQYSLQREAIGADAYTHLIAVQFVLRY